MSVLPRQRVQCDRCLTVFVLTAKRADHWGAELHDANWVARPAGGGGAYRHACALCAGEFLAEIEARQTPTANAGAR